MLTNNWVAKKTKGSQQTKKHTLQCFMSYENRITSHHSKINVIKKIYNKEEKTKSKATRKKNNSNNRRSVIIPTCAKVSVISIVCYDIINIKIVAWKMHKEHWTQNKRMKESMCTKPVFFFLLSSVVQQAQQYICCCCFSFGILVAKIVEWHGNRDFKLLHGNSLLNSRRSLFSLFMSCMSASMAWKLCDISRSQKVSPRKQITWNDHSNERER